jgi:hypothetical protein
MGKVFKQIQDAHRRAAEEPAPRAAKDGAREEPRPKR